MWKWSQSTSERCLTYDGVKFQWSSRIQSYNWVLWNSLMCESLPWRPEHNSSFCHGWIDHYNSYTISKQILHLYCTVRFTFTCLHGASLWHANQMRVHALLVIMITLTSLAAPTRHSNLDIAFFVIVHTKFYPCIAIALTHRFKSIIPIKLSFYCEWFGNSFIFYNSIYYY